MKAFHSIFGVALLTLASCSSGLYVGTEYDDLYYQSTDKPVVRVQSAGNQPIVEGDLRADNYYDNIYAADTLVSKDFSDAVEYDNTVVNNNYYFDDYSYSGRLRRFYGNYFYPYWRDPFYMMPSFGYSYFYSGYPYYYNPYYYDPFYYDPFYYGYGGFYSSYYYGVFYNRFYSPFYYGGYYSPFYHNYWYSSDFGIAYGRRERPSTYSSRWSAGGSGISPQGSASRRTTSVSEGSGSSGAIGSTSGDVVTSGSRRAAASSGTTQQSGTSSERRFVQDPSRSGSDNISGTQSRRSSADTKPEYNSVNRSYTPSYSNPRMSTRPSYNNTRVNSNINSSTGSGQRSIQNPSSGRSYSPYSSQPRSGSSGSGASSYSAPSRRSSDGGLSSGSYRSSGSSSYSGGSSYGSVSRSSSGSYSSGSYSSGSSSSGSSSSGSSGRRR